MPELPEVETVKEILKKQIINETIKEIDIYYDKIIENVTKEEFIKALTNETICTLNRYGKYLIIIFTKHALICHLRMEGKFFLKNISDPIEKHEHIVFNFVSGKCLRYHDTRKFGKMALIYSTDMNEIMKYKSLIKLGPEANGNIITKEYLFNCFSKCQMPIKSVLLDQNIIAGLGNIYVDEVCFLCNLNPQEPANFLTMEDAGNIINACKVTLTKAISEGGTTIRSYTSSLGVTGRFQQHLHVHTKAGEPCSVCHTTIVKTRVGGRGTYYCPTCQRKRQVVVGITGMIGSGKTTIDKYLIGNGYDIIDCDDIVKKLYKTEKVKKIIQDSFGENYITNNEINRKLLSQLVFQNEEKRMLLDSLIHPLVKEKITLQLKKEKKELVFVDIPLLYEAKFNDLCNYVMVVYSSHEKNVERIISRDNVSYEEALIKMKSQLPIMTKCALADFIIDNSGDLCYTYKQVNKIINFLE